MMRVLIALVALALPMAAAAKDVVRVVDSQAIVFDAYALRIAKEEGYFDAENLDVSIIVGRGGSDSLQAIITGSQDIIYGTGILAVISAAAKGAPVVILANSELGSPEIYWFVRADSPIKTFRDLDGGHDFIYSTPGSVTHLISQTIAKELGIKPKFVSAGASTASRTQMMSGQIETAWGTFPNNLDLMRAGQVRQIGTGADSKVISMTTTRVSAANTDWLAKNRDVAIRFMRALWKGEEYMFSKPDAIPRFGKYWNIAPEDANQALDYFKLERHRFAPIGNVDGLPKMAQEYGFLKEPVTPEQAKKMIDVVYESPAR